MVSSAEICVVRHGETDWNVQGILQGSIDVPLNDHGRAQARELAAHFAAYAFTCIHTSPLSRALETAEIIARQLQLPAPTTHPGLCERNFGVVQGIPKTELAELNPLLCQQVVQRNPLAQFENGEPLDDFADRILASLEDIAATHPGERILLITHGWVMDVITRHVHGVPRTTTLAMKRKNGEALWLAATADSIKEIPAPAGVDAKKNSPQPGTAMGRVEWTEALRIGVSEIDQQHQKLIDIRNRLALSCAADNPTRDDDFHRILSELFEYTRAHFQAEEDFMESIDFPQQASQHQQHGQFIDTIVEFSAAASNGTANQEEGVHFLTHWLLSHICHSDMEIRYFLAGRHG